MAKRKDTSTNYACDNRPTGRATESPVCPAPDASPVLQPIEEITRRLRLDPSFAKSDLIMTTRKANGLPHYYELVGKGTPLVLIHGAFADSRVWEPQWRYFSSRVQLVRYDLRGHGRTGRSQLDRYSMDTFADDLASLLDALGIHSPVLCGLSWGGSIAQAFAVRYPGRVKALVLAGSSVSIRLTLIDRLLCDVLFPRWAMLLTIRLFSVDYFTRFSFWLARLTRGRQWLSQEETTREYLEECMLAMDKDEYLKIWGALYGFNLLPLETIASPTLVLNGEYEPKSTYRHSLEILHRISQSQANIVPKASHAMNLDNPEVFNGYLAEFLNSTA
jgi:pimeloyl-ACP methyl ester carboxylesterase